MARTVSIAACNFAVRPVAGFDEFAAHVQGMLDQAEGADLVLFPELFTVELFTTFPDWKETPISELTRIAEFTAEYRSLFEGEAKERSQYIVGKFCGVALLVLTATACLSGVALLSILLTKILYPTFFLSQFS